MLVFLLIPVLLVLGSGVVLGQCRAAYRRIQRLNRGRGHGIISRNGHYQPAMGAPGTSPLVLGILGDSLSAGLGVRHCDHAPSALLGQGLADQHHRPVTVINMARPGAGARDLDRQAHRLLGSCTPDLCVIAIGANDVGRPHRLHHSARALGAAVDHLTRHGAQVLAATCPALTTSTAIPRPARWVLHLSGLLLARLQHRQITAHGGQTLALHAEVSPSIARGRLLSADGFHPDEEGYRIAAAAILARLPRPAAIGRSAESSLSKELR